MADQSSKMAVTIIGSTVDVDHWIKPLGITKTRPCSIQRFFKAVKKTIFK